MGFPVPSPLQFADTWRIAQNAAPLASDIVEAICWCEICKLSHLGTWNNWNRWQVDGHLLHPRLYWRVFAGLLYDLTHLYVNVMSLLCPCYVLVPVQFTPCPEIFGTRFPQNREELDTLQGFKMETPLPMLLEKWLFGGAVVCQTRTASDLWRFKLPSGFRFSPGLGFPVPFSLGTICRPSLLLNLIMMKMMMTTTGHWNYEIIWMNGFCETRKSSCCLRKCCLRPSFQDRADQDQAVLQPWMISCLGFYCVRRRSQAQVQLFCEGQRTTRQAENFHLDRFYLSSGKSFCSYFPMFIPNRTVISNSLTWSRGVLGPMPLHPRISHY